MGHITLSTYSKHVLHTNRYLRSQSSTWSTNVLFLSWGLLVLQGLFFETINGWVVNRTFFVFDLLPFNLYPSDLFLLPFLLVTTIFAISHLGRNVPTNVGYVIPMGIVALAQVTVAFAARWLAPMPLLGPLMWTDFLLLPASLSIVPLLQAVKLLRLNNSGRQTLLFGWWTVLSLGLLIGALNQNPNILGDLRTLLIRPMVAVAVFFLALSADLNTLVRWIVRLGVILASYLFLASLLRFSGFPVLPFSPLYAGIPLLLPYAIVLAQILLRTNRNGAPGLVLAVLALAILMTLAKALIAAFIACNLIGLLLIGRGSLGKHMERLIRIAVSLAIVAVFGTLLLVSSGGGDSAITYVSRTYLKEGAAVQDLSGSRFSIWQLGLEKWRERPLQGHGLGFILSGMVLDLGLGRFVPLDSIDAHNFIVEMMYKIGSLGTLAVIILAIHWLRLSLSAYKSHEDLQSAAVHLALIVTILTIWVLALYGPHVSHAVTGFMLWFALGIEAALTTSKNRLRQETVSPIKFQKQSFVTQ